MPISLVKRRHQPVAYNNPGETRFSMNTCVTGRQVLAGTTKVPSKGVASLDYVDAEIETRGRSQSVARAKSV